MENMKQFIYKRTIWLVVVVVTMLTSCSETFEEYKVNLEVVTELVTDNNTWFLERFNINEIPNSTVANSDTAAFKCITFKAYDNSFPIRRSFTGKLYFNEFMREGDITTMVTKNGLLDECTVVQAGETNSTLLTYSNQNNDKDLPPAFTVYSHDSDRGLISGVLFGRLFSNSTDDSMIFRLTLENYRYNTPVF